MQEEKCTPIEQLTGGLKRKLPPFDLLRLSSFLNPDCIPFELIIQGASDLGPELHEFITRSEDPVLAVAEALEPLARFSLVHVDPANEMYSMHRLVQEVLKARDET